MPNTSSPLPVTPWEEFFLEDDFENYPANFITRIRCRGLLTESLLRSALHQNLKQHPLFDSIIAKNGRQLVWKKCLQEQLPVSSETSSAELDIPLPLKKEPFKNRLWRMHLVQFHDSKQQQYTDLIVDIHHSLCDGLGALQFLSEMALCIDEIHSRGKIQSSDNAAHPRTDNSSNPQEKWAALSRRGKFRQNWREVIGTIPYHYKSVLASLRMMFSKVDPLVPVNAIRDLLHKPKCQLGYCRLSFDVNQSSRLRRLARMKGSTLNSLIACQIFKSISEWKLKQGHPSRNNIRILMPFNERKISDRQLPACNRVSISPFTKNQKQIEDQKTLLASLNNDIRLVKRKRLGLNFHRVLFLWKKITGSLKGIANTRRVGATCMFTNLGNIQALLSLPYEHPGLRCGPILIEDIEPVAPIRIGTSMAMILYYFSGETRIGIHYDSSLLSQDEAADFVNFFRTGIEALID